MDIVKASNVLMKKLQNTLKHQHCKDFDNSKMMGILKRELLKTRVELAG